MGGMGENIKRPTIRLNSSVVSRTARGPGFRFRSDHHLFLPYDNWRLNAGLREGHHYGHDSPVPPWFRADSGKNLIKQGEYQGTEHVSFFIPL